MTTFTAIKPSSPVTGDVCFWAAAKLVSSADLKAQRGHSRQDRLMSAQGQSETLAVRALISAFRVSSAGSGQSASVKSFGRREAYESPRGRNPRTPVEGYGDFDLRLMCAVAGSQSESGMLDGGQVASLRTRAAFRVWPRLAATLSAAMIATDACGSVAGSGVTPATEVLTMPCRVMKPSPGSSPSHPAVRAAASSIRTSR